MKRIITMWFIIFIMLGCKTETSPGSLKSTNKWNLINDPEFEKGIGILGTCSEIPGVKEVLYPYGNPYRNSKPYWKLAEWGSNDSLFYVDAVYVGDTIYFKRASKEIGFLRKDTITQVLFRVNASKEFDVPRKEGEDWPHLLLEQKLSGHVRLAQMDSIHHKLHVELLQSTLEMKTQEIDTSLHTSQFSLYFSVQDTNRNSEGYGDYFWFGLPIYDYRFEREIPQYAAQDIGKQDATQKFILKIGSRELYEGTLQNKKELKYEKDILPFMKKGYQMARERGYLERSDWKDMCISGFNIGWEVPGTFNNALMLKQFEVDIFKK